MKIVNDQNQHILRKKHKKISMNKQETNSNQYIDIWITKTDEKKHLWSGICQLKDMQEYTSVTTLSNAAPMIFSKLIENLTLKLKRSKHN